MANDGSIGTLMEDWIITQIRLIQHEGQPVFETAEVEPWGGTEAGTLSALKDELFTGQRDLVCRVFYHRDHVIELEGGEIKVVPRYVILVGIRNRRQAAARRGDDQVIGTNLLRDLLRYALHDKRPLNAQAELVNDGTTAVDRTYFRGSEIVLNKPKACIQQTIVEVDEVPKP